MTPNWEQELQQHASARPAGPAPTAAPHLQAATEVDAMQKELSEAKVVVEQATVECNELLVVSA